MSVHVAEAVWQLEVPEHQGVSIAAQKLVLLCFANYAAADGTRMYPAMSTIQRLTGLSERAVRNTVRALEAHGLIVRTCAQTPRKTAEYQMGPWYVADPRWLPARGALSAPQRGTGNPSRGALSAPDPSLNRPRTPDFVPEVVERSPAGAAMARQARLQLEEQIGAEGVTALKARERQAAKAKAREELRATRKPAKASRR